MSGRTSKILAPLFVDFIGVQGEVLDVGCGTGALTFAIAKTRPCQRLSRWTCLTFSSLRVLQDRGSTHKF